MSTDRSDPPVTDLVTGSIRLVHPTLSLRRAAVAMATDEIGLLVVEGVDGGLAGVVSERDLVGAMARRADLDGERVDACMADRVLTVDGTTTIRAATELMVDADVRHLVVIDTAGAPTGVISARDAMRGLTAMPA